MKLSIIIPTLGRKIQVDELLSSLIEVKNFSHEILIVDQNFNELLDDVVNRYTELNITHEKVDFRSLSKAKNFGINWAKGEIICFPDDDSKLIQGTILKAVEYLDQNDNVDAVFGRCIDEHGEDSVIKFNSNDSFLTLKDFEGKFIEATMFSRTQLLKDFLFDENLGVGSFFGAEEGYDLVYRLLKCKKVLFYNSKLRFYHPQTLSNYNSLSALKRVYNYRLGYAYLCQKHSFQYKFFKRLLTVLFAIILFSFVKPGKSRYYIVEFCALISGKIISKRIDNGK